MKSALTFIQTRNGCLILTESMPHDRFVFIDHNFATLLCMVAASRFWPVVFFVVHGGV